MGEVSVGQRLGSAALIRRDSFGRIGTGATYGFSGGATGPQPEGPVRPSFSTTTDGG
jgi:hypothetical protein